MRCRTLIVGSTIQAARADASRAPRARVTSAYIGVYSSVNAAGKSRSVIFGVKEKQPAGCVRVVHRVLVPVVARVLAFDLEFLERDGSRVGPRALVSKGSTGGGEFLKHVRGRADRGTEVSRGPVLVLHRTSLGTPTEILHAISCPCARKAVVSNVRQCAPRRRSADLFARVVLEFDEDVFCVPRREPGSMRVGASVNGS